MGDHQNLNGNEAIAKIKALAEDARMCMLSTSLGKVPSLTRPMALQVVEEDGSTWFFSEADSDKNKEIAEDPRVQLTFMNNSSSEYLSLYGEAEIVRDVEKAKELWSTWVKTWFPEGPEDPNLSLIKFMPKEGYYWDTKNGKMVSLFKIAVGALTGKTMDDGVEGKVKI